MKVYMLYVSIPYEGGWVYGIYSTKEKAEEKLHGEHIYWREHSEIIEMTMDEFTDISI